MKFARPINDTSPNITQSFGPNHKGTDYGYPDGTPIYASQSGTVVLMKKGETRQWIANTSTDPYPHPRPLITDDYGNFVKIDHGEGYETLYAHQRPNSITVSTGQSVKQGQLIGAVGSTGNSTGNHLHWEIRRNGIVIDPTPLMDTTFTNYGQTGGEQPMDQEIKNRADAFVAVCDKLKKPVNKDIVLADIDRFLRLEDDLEQSHKDLIVKEKQMDEIRGKAKEMEDTIARLKKENESLGDKNDKQIEASKKLSDKIGEQADLIKGLGDEVNNLKKQKSINEMSPVEIILYGISKLLKK